MYAVSPPQLINNTNSVIQENVDEMKASQDEIKATISAMERKQTEIKVSRFAGNTKILHIFYRKLDSVIKQPVAFNSPIFSEGLMCLRFEWKLYTHLEILTGNS